MGVPPVFLAAKVFGFWSRGMKKILVAASFLLLSLCSCQQELETFPLHERVVPKEPVKLPDHPDFAALARIQDQYDDGAYTTWGVIKNQKKLMAREVRVRGRITEISDDCPALTDPKFKRVKKVGKKRVRTGYQCKGLYVMIKSPEDVNKSLMIIGYHPYFHPHFKLGMEMDVSGAYLMSSNQFMRSRDGLVHTFVINNMAVDKKGNFVEGDADAALWRKRGDQVPMRQDAPQN